MNDFVCALTHVTSTFLPGNVRQRTEPGLTDPRRARAVRAQTWSITCAECAAEIFGDGDLACDRRRAIGAAGKWPGDERGGRGSEEKEEARAAGRTNLSRAACLRANGRFQTGMGEMSCGRMAALPACAVTAPGMKSGCGRRPGPGQCPPEMPRTLLPSFTSGAGSAGLPPGSAVMDARPLPALARYIASSACLINCS